MIDSQMKREYRKILDDADRSANRINHMYVPSRVLHDSPSGKLLGVRLPTTKDNLLCAAAPKPALCVH